MYVQHETDEAAAKAVADFAASGLEALTPRQIADAASEGAHRVAAAIRGLPAHLVSKQQQQQQRQEAQGPPPPEERQEAPSEDLAAFRRALPLKTETDALNRVAAAADKLRKVRWCCLMLYHSRDCLLSVPSERQREKETCRDKG